MANSVMLELGLIEITLENDDLTRALELITKLKTRPGIEQDPDYYLCQFYHGQALLRLAMQQRKRSRLAGMAKKKVLFAVSHLEHSIACRSDFIDSHMVLGLALTVKAAFSDNQREDLERAQKHYETALASTMINPSQEEYIRERLNGVENELARIDQQDRVT